MTTIHISVQSSLAPERVLEAAHDFSARRAEVWPAVSVARLTVHDRGDTWADVTEGTRAGPVVNWERCRYDWSQPSSVTATVIDSNVYAVPGSSWEVKTEPSDGGSSVEMIWAREFRSGPRGLLFATAFRLVGKRVFGGYAQQVLDNLERLERTPPGPPDAMPSPSSHHLPNSKPAPRVRHARGARLRCSSRGWALRGGRAALSVLAAAVLVLAGCPSALAAPLGQIAEFPTGLQPSNDSYPFGIAAGADGNLWFTDRGTLHEIGRITPTGQDHRVLHRPATGQRPV